MVPHIQSVLFDHYAVYTYASHKAHQKSVQIHSLYGRSDQISSIVFMPSFKQAICFVQSPRGPKFGLFRLEHSRFERFFLVLMSLGTCLLCRQCSCFLTLHWVHKVHQEIENCFCCQRQVWFAIARKLQTGICGANVTGGAWPWDKRSQICN